jgi:hypothetical protein
MTAEGTDRIVSFALERHRIYLRRAAGEPWPWTQDKILQTYRFCNVYRELDTTTAWLRKNWFDPHHADPDAWFAAAVARHVNWVPTLKLLGYPVPWVPGRLSNLLGVMMAQKDEYGGTVYSGAYMIRSGGMPGVPRAVYLDRDVLTPLWNQRQQLCYRPYEPLADMHSRLTACYGLGSFMAAQIIADAKFCGAMLGAPDWWTFAAPGPGSQRGLNRVLGRAPKSPWKLDEWIEENERLRWVLNQVMLDYGYPGVSGQDTQNCLCEFDKMERARLGEGRPKQLMRSRV